MELYSSLSLDVLADDMIRRVCDKKNWNSLFAPPVVVFSDSKVEQWFKLRWVQKSKNSVLLNLKTYRLDEFLFEILGGNKFENDADSLKLLSPSFLRNALISKLTKKIGGKYYFETLDSCEVTDYLFDSDSENGGEGAKNLNSVRLYDFAGWLSGLFFEYELTRAGDFSDAGKKSAFFKDSWQGVLYDDVFSEVGKLGFTTLLRLSNQSDSPKKYSWDFSRPVFLFGFSGIGQLYHKILSDFAKSGANFSVYLQVSEKNPEKIAGGEAKNALLERWSLFGVENLELWKSDSAGGAFRQISLDEDDLFKNHLENLKGSLTLTAAPSQIREVEAVHSKICALLSEKRARLCDILVVSPKIQDYRTSIEQVFDQNSWYDKEFPYVPYKIADYSSENSFTAGAISVLSSVARKKYLCRSDLFALLRNPLVQCARNFSDGQVSDWSEWAESLNVFRDRGEGEERIEDWEKAKDRLLLSRLTGDLVKTDENDENQLLPYEVLESEDDDSLYKFADAIDSLLEWVRFSEKFGRGKNLSCEQIFKIREIFESWLLADEDALENLGMKSESYVFQDVLSEFDCLAMIAEKNENGFDSQSLLFALLEAASACSFHSANIFTRGVTFASFKPNGILGAKYVFFMGCDSKSFPGEDKKNVLDLRFAEKGRVKGDDSIPMKNKNAFLCQIMAAEKGFFVSYVNKNLQKDEDFYKSSVVTDLFEAIYPNVFDEDKKNPENEERRKETLKKFYEELSIDEKRGWEKLFTRREFRNKRNFARLNETQPDKGKSGVESASSVPEKDAKLDSLRQAKQKVYPDRVSVSQMKKFLSDPFVFVAESVFGGDDDEDSDDELQEFEPLVFDRLTKSQLRKDFVRETLTGGQAAQARGGFIQSLKNENVLPDGDFGEFAFSEIEGQGNEVLNAIKELDIGEIVCDGAANLPMSGQFSSVAGENQEKFKKEWSVTGKLSWHNKDFEDGTLNLIELSKTGLLSSYVSALVLLASLPDGEKEIQVKIFHIIFDSGKLSSTPYPFNMTGNGARKILSEIYRLMFVNPFRKCVPYSVLESETALKKELETEEKKKKKSKKAPIKKLRDLKGKLFGFYGAWEYFSKKDLFNVETDIGYTEQDFENQWEEACECMKRLIRILG